MKAITTIITIMLLFLSNDKAQAQENNTTNFKELSIEYTYDNNGKLLEVKIKKCN